MRGRERLSFVKINNSEKYHPNHKKSKFTKKKLLIFIISYKASFRVLDVYNKIPFNKIKKFKTNVLISDDYSNDETIFYIKKIKKKKNVHINFNKINLGYGAHIKKCLNFAIKKNFHYAIMLHGDNQYDPKYIPKLLNIAASSNDNNVIAITGSRLKKGYVSAMSQMPKYKLLGNILLTKFFNFLFSQNFTDAHTGLWLYNLDYIKNINYKLLTNKLNFDHELRFKSINDNKIIKEISIDAKYGDERSQLHIIYALKFVFCSILFFLHKKKIIKITKFL